MIAGPPLEAKSGHEFGSQERNSVRVQLVPDNVYPLAPIDPRRDRAAKMRFYFASAVSIFDHRQAWLLVYCWRSMLAQIFSEIGRVLIDVQQSFTGCAFGIDHVVTGELDMKILQRIEFGGIMTGDGHAVHEVARLYQHAIDQYRMGLRDVQIGLRNVEGECRAGNPDRQNAPHPALARITLFEGIATDPLDGARPAKCVEQQIAGLQLFDLPLAIHGADPGAFQKTTKIISAYILMVFFAPVEPEEISGLRRRCRGLSQESGGRYGTYSYQITARALDCV